MAWEKSGLLAQEPFLDWEETLRWPASEHIVLVPWKISQANILFAIIGSALNQLGQHWSRK